MLQSPPAILNLMLAALLLTGLGGIGGCANDPSKRTPGVFIDDAVLEPMVKREIRSKGEFDGSHLVVVAYNGVVLIAGQVATEALRDTAGEAAQGLRRVRKVHNELSIGGPISLVARTNDSWLTTKVKTRLIASDNAYGRKIKVLTENGVVYLMGLLTRNQADQAVDVAAKVYGVQKIIKVFEYLD